MEVPTAGDNISKQTETVNASLERKETITPVSSPVPSVSNPVGNVPVAPTPNPNPISTPSQSSTTTLTPPHEQQPVTQTLGQAILQPTSSGITQGGNPTVNQTQPIIVDFNNN